MKELLEFLAMGGTIKYIDTSFAASKFRFSLGENNYDICFLMRDVEEGHCDSEISRILYRLKRAYQ